MQIIAHMIHSPPKKRILHVHKVGACVCVKMYILKGLQGNTAMILRD